MYSQEIPSQFFNAVASQKLVYDIFFFSTLIYLSPIPAGIYLLKVNNRNTRRRCEIYSKLTIKTPERPHLGCSGVFIINFEHISWGRSGVFIVNFEHI